MSVVRNTIKAIKIKMMLNRLSKAKENAMREFLGLPPKRSWFEQCYTGCMTAIKDKCCQVFCPCCVYDIKRRLKRPTCWDSAFFKELLGFLGGAFLTVVLYLLMIYQIGWTPSTAFYVSSVSGLVITLPLAFSVNMRCFVLLMIPQLFSGKGRMFLLMYALFLVMNHPMKNFNANIMVMSESATCGQEMALNKTKDLVKTAMAPMQTIMKSVKKVLAKVKDFAASLKQVYVNCKKVVTEIGAVMKRIADWLGGVVDRCNEEMGRPYKKCIAAFNYAEGECKRWRWPGVYVSLCSHALVVGELLCLITQVIKDIVAAEFEQPVVNVLNDAARMFDFTVDVSYEFNFTVVQSKSYKQIKEDIKREITSRMDILIRFVKITEVVMLAAVFFIVIKACVYRTRYLCDERYDNVYITYAVRDLDERRKEVGKEGILPLNNDECGKYVQSNSATMISSEKKKLVLGIFFLFISLFNAGFYMMCDVGLYYVLFIVAKHFSGDTGNMPSPPHTKLHVTGQGPMANMYKSIVSMFDPIAGASVQVNAGQCTPIPKEPDWVMYDQIGVIYLLCLIMTISESYGLRLRHLIMGCYYPKQERQRAVWLYNHIVKSRGGIIQRARKKMHGVQFGDVAVQHISLRGQLAASFPILERLFKWCGWEVKSCLYCGREGKPDDYMNFVHCAFSDCNAIYCVDCFADLKNVCAVCSNPVELQGSDASEEQDSSIDEAEKEKLKIQREYREGRIQQIQDARRPSKVFLGLKEMIDEADPASKEVEPTQTEQGSSTKQIAGENDTSSEDTDTRQSEEESSIEDEMFSRKQHMQNINQNKLQIQYGSDAVFSPSSSVCSIDVISSEEESENASQDINFGATRSKINISASIFHASDRNKSNRCIAARNTDIDDSDSESFVSSCSSVDSKDLDYEYQFEETAFARGVEYSSDSSDHDDNNNNKLDIGSSKSISYRDELITSGVFSDSESDNVSSDDEDSELIEPEEIRLHRT